MKTVVVGIWSNFVKADPDESEQLPDLSNLREVVFNTLDKVKA
ncbi:hypothetical protein AAHH17_02315 [Lysinibacillus capsici]